jgi:prolyl oligopeptidase
MTEKTLKTRALPLVAIAFLALLTSCSRDDRPTAAAPETRAAAPAPPPPVVHEYHGVKVQDDYAWLEKTDAPEVRQWTAAQNAKAREHLDKLPERAFVAEELERLYAKMSPNYSALAWRAGKLFLLKFEPPAQQPVLITLTSLTNLKTAKLVLDPNQLDTNGTTSIDWFVPSLDGKLVAVSLSEKGSEDGTLHFFDAETGAQLADTIPRVQYPTGGGSAAWNADGSGIFYTRYPAKGERPDEDLHFHQQIYLHKLGTPVEQDTFECGKEFPRIAEVDLQSSQDGRHLLASVANGDGGDYAYYLRTPQGEWKLVAGFADHVKQAEFGRDPLYVEWGRSDSLFLLSTKDAPKGQILRVKLSHPDLASAKVAVAESTNVIRDFKPTASGLAIVYMKGGPSQFVYKDFFNTAASGPSSRSVSPDFKIPTSVSQVVVTRGDEILFRAETYTEPFMWWVYDTNKERDNPHTTALRGRSPVPFSDVEALRVQAVSKDGTNVPMTILRKKGTRMTGDNPTLLTGYGGYGISRTPNFDFARRVWFDQGGIIAIANLRGGGEFGEEWHKAGNLTNKQNVFNDFAACAEFLVRSNYTNPSKLAIEGGSNGGLLMGATLTQHPDLARAVVSHVGIYDMLRVELDPNGEFNTTEFGTVKDPEQFKALHAYSPYHRVQNDTKYPAVLMLTGEHDGRVNPAHSRKMTARLQAASSSKLPILLRTSSSSGHGIGTALNERVAQLSDVYAFLLEQLGVNYSLISRGPWSGAVTPTSAIVKARLPREDMTASLLLSKDPGLASPLRFGPARSDTNHYDIVAFDVQGLEPDTPYHYALEINGRLDQKKRGEFRTFPKADEPASFQIAFASCGRTGSTRDVYDRIREHRPLFYMNMGDFHYEDIRSNSVALFRGAYDKVLASPQQSDLYRAVPFVYMWDDHDYGGNNANRKSTTHPAARRAYDEYVPHYPFGDADKDAPIYQSFVVGRVKFILTDLRSERDDPKDKDDEFKTILGAKQKEWLKKELLASNGKYPLICWMSSVPFIGERGKSPYRFVRTNEWGFIHHTNLVGRTNRSGTVAAAEEAEKAATNAVESAEGADSANVADAGKDTANSAKTTNTTARATTATNAVAGAQGNGNRQGSGRGQGGGRGQRGGNNNPQGGGGDEDHWSAFSTERREIADFIKSNHISGVCILHGDSHMMAADNGTHADYATGGGAPIPVMCGGPLDQNPSLKGGPYSQGVYRVRDKEGESGFGLLNITDKGSTIEVYYSGHNNKDEEKISLRFSVPAQAPGMTAKAK